MAKTDNPHSERLYQSLLTHTDEATAAQIAHHIPLSKSADFKKKFAWAEDVCQSLMARFDDETIRAIRMDCACSPEMGKIGSLQKLYAKSSDLDDFAAKANAHSQGFTIRHENDALFLCYSECYCSCVKRVDKEVPVSWCYCTLGYTKKMFTHILGRAVGVELIESVKTGGRQCIIKVV